MGRASKGRDVAAVTPAVILVRPQLGENIGMAARAMLNCGLSTLRLVAPRDGWPNERAQRAASGADIVLEKAEVFDSVGEAVADLERVVATTARNRELTQRILTPRHAAAEMRGWIGQGEGVGIMFGPERTFAWNALGRFQAEAGFHDKAAETFAKVIELDPTFDTAYLERAKARVASGDRARAAADLDLALEKASEEFRPEILLARGKFLESGGDQERALADFVAARTAQIDLFDAWMAEAGVLKALGRLEDSKTAAREALQLRPGDKAARVLSEGG